MARPVLALLAAVCLALPLATALASEPAPRNPFLANSSYPLGHANAAQQDSVPQAGPSGPGRRLDPAEVDYAPVGPAHFGASTSGPYPGSQRRVLWSNGLDRIVKIDHESFEVLAEKTLPGAVRYEEAEAEASIAAFNESNAGIFALYRAFRESRKLMDLSGVYTLLDADHVYYIGARDGGIAAWGDVDPRDPASPIVLKRRFRMPEAVTGSLVGMNMTFDGWIVVATEDGYVVAIRRDFGAHTIARLRHSEGAEEKATGAVGYGWVRNGVAIDTQGGLYIASQEHMHKLVWTGERLSRDPADGAWTAAYRNGWGHGTGATPSLMGFGDEDRFVVITDGEPIMNVTLFWRDAIPDDWEALPGAPDRRIAGMLPADMGDPELAAIQSEQSVVVSGHGALVVNNVPRGAPWYLPEAALPLLISYLGSHPGYQPYGVQKFRWDPQARRFRRAWVNREISSPSCVPIVSAASSRVYLVGARDNRFSLEALDWETGEPVFHHVIGDQRYNPLFSGTLVDERGRIHFGTPWGRARLDPGAPHS